LSELLIALLDAEQEPIDGRTTIQKLAYFASVKTGSDVGFHPHYYGPYSPQVATQLEDLVGSDFIVEIGRHTIRDRIMYSYCLTEDGKIVARNVMKKYPEEYSTVKQITSKCRKIAHNNISILSWAAKVHYILSQTNKPMTYNEAVELGRRYGWKPPATEMESAIDLLLSLGLIKKQH
jgi:hypothetical protein